MEKVQTAIPVDTAFALPAVETILKEFATGADGAALALNIRQLHLPFEAMLSVPVQALVWPGESRNEWQLHIRAATTPALYPVFDGKLVLAPAAERGCILQLDGSYAPPLGIVGRAIDVTLLRGIARSSLERFVREVARRVAALARWTNIA